MINGIDRGPSPCDNSRTIALADWTGLGVPLLRAPREFVTELHQRHLPKPGTTVVAVLDPEQRVVASASFAVRPQLGDGWEHRNALLTQLRRITPHDLKRAAPSRAAVLLRCRDGRPGWTEQDGAWMWALRAAAELHGLRCGSYLTLTPAGWQSIGDGRRGRNPHSGSWTLGPLHTVTELPPPGYLRSDRPPAGQEQSDQEQSGQAQSDQVNGQTPTDPAPNGQTTSGQTTSGQTADDQANSGPTISDSPQTTSSLAARSSALRAAAATRSARPSLTTSTTTSRRSGRVAAASA